MSIRISKWYGTVCCEADGWCYDVQYSSKCGSYPHMHWCKQSSNFSYHWKRNWANLPGKPTKRRKKSVYFCYKSVDVQNCCFVHATWTSGTISGKLMIERPNGNVLFDDLTMHTRTRSHLINSFISVNGIMFTRVPRTYHYIKPFFGFPLQRFSSIVAIFRLIKLRTLQENSKDDSNNHQTARCFARDEIYRHLVFLH